MTDITSLKTVLVANRGEIALRAIRTCRDLNIRTIGIYSTPDSVSPHAWLADKSVCIGPASAENSYLCAESLIHIAKETNCDGIYPGYGFLAENAKFAELCEENNIKFVGPSSKIIATMGDKVEARKVAILHGVPVVPGSSKAFTDASEAQKEAMDLGFPLLLKARSGGGGKGMRVVEKEIDFFPAFGQAMREAMAAFGDGGIYLERFFPKVRHIEIQVLGDGKGEALAFEERDCSLQRRHQKLIEESPSPKISKVVREKLIDVALKITRGISYEGAGTVEFIFDEEDQKFYFIEMNTRIQVEHPVTEMRYDIDLVKAQFEIASGKKILPHFRKAVKGHAIQFRINAEDWRRNFFPSPGVLKFWSPPLGDGIRVDSAAYRGLNISPYYDSLVAKLIIFGLNRDDCLKKAGHALSRFGCEGIESTIDFHKMIIEHFAFQKSKIHTRWIDNEMRLT